MFSSNDTPAAGIRVMQTRSVESSTWMISLTLNVLNDAVGHIPETISCRYNPGGVFTLISNDIMDNPGDAKYGMTTGADF